MAPVKEPKTVEVVDDTPAPVAETAETESRPIVVDEEEEKVDNQEESKETTAPSATENADDDDLLFDVV